MSPELKSGCVLYKYYRLSISVRALNNIQGVLHFVWVTYNFVIWWDANKVKYRGEVAILNTQTQCLFKFKVSAIVFNMLQKF